MKKHTIDYSLTGMLPDLVKAYLDEQHHVNAFYRVPLHLDNIIQSAGQRKFNSDDRQLLFNVLTSQYEAVYSSTSVSEAVRKNIALLKEENTFTVTTGHQLNLFTGPLYFIYKIASTINLANQVKQAKPGFHVVPVYWMASEDHDLAEINHFHLFGRRFQWEHQKDGAVGRLSCDELGGILEQVQQAIGETAHGKQLVELFRKAYAEGRSLSEATRVLVNELFGRHGLVILDADHADLKSRFADIMTDDATRHEAFKTVGATLVKLEAQYKAQVHPREINLFYLDTHFRGRIEKKDGGYAVLDHPKKFSGAELPGAIKAHPEMFSPNVVLRPMYQETVLPNLAMVGGPAEIAYWLEYKAMFDHYQVPFPCLVLRGCAMILDQGMQAKLNKLGLSPEDIFKPGEVLIKEFISRNSETAFLEEARKKVESVFDTLSSKISEVDVTLKASAEGEKQKSLKAIQALEEKVMKAYKRKNESAVSQIEKIKTTLFPEQSLQERHENFMSFYSKWGDAFLDDIVNQLNPLEKKFFIFTEE